MARLAECDFPSDDDLPSFDGLLARPAGERTINSKPSALVSPLKKDLVPKSTTKPSVRKVRRLNGGTKLTDNPLFQPWNSEENGGSESPSRRSPSKLANRFNRTFQEHTLLGQQIGLPSEQDTTPLRARSTRPRKQRFVPIVDEDSEDDTSQESNSFQLRIQQLKHNSQASDTSALGTDPSVKSDESSAMTWTEADEDQEIAAQLEQCQTDSFISAKGNGESADDASGYPTASEETGVFSDNLQAGFEMELSSDQRPQHQPLKVLAGESDPVAGVHKKLSDLVCPVLQPRHANIKSIKPVNQDGADGKPKSQVESPSKPLRVLATQATAEDLADSFSKLRLQYQDVSEDEVDSPEHDRFATPPHTPPKKSKSKNTASPVKRPLIPQTPHRPNADAFWNQEFVDDWNDQHSPRKLMPPPAAGGLAKAGAKPVVDKESRKSFEATKHTVAQEFLAQLDTEITHGKVAELAASTGGVKLVWTKTLNTTAGRANWRRETIRTKGADGAEVDVQHKHHASIELAEKVIDNEHRLLNVLAHEFCHLANFMVNGITNNPHGKEFKVWAAKCSSTFGARGIEVTTKHTYDIDFKYIWECTSCGSEYKRHSRSIDPEKHRCGACKNVLKQTKPVPRASGKPSEYQIFMKEQMKLIKSENPGSPQKDVMRMVADKWAKRSETTSTVEDETMVSQVVDLTLDERADP